VKLTSWPCFSQRKALLTASGLLISKDAEVTLHYFHTLSVSVLYISGITNHMEAVKMDGLAVYSDAWPQQ